MQFLLDVWREASQHPELEDAVDRIARLLSSQAPADAVVVRALDFQHSQIQTVAAGLVRPGSGSAVSRSSTTCSPDDFNQVLAWCRRDEVTGRICGRSSRRAEAARARRRPRRVACRSARARRAPDRRPSSLVARPSHVRTETPFDPRDDPRAGRVSRWQTTAASTSSRGCVKRLEADKRALLSRLGPTRSTRHDRRIRRGAAR